tara:strand:+ start:535 stop:735 length:201 start_codon:yes stop_codon:yes gene_type:complete
MVINLDEHKYFDERSKLDVVPLSIAKKAVEEAKDNSLIKQLDQAINTLSEELTSINPDLTQLEDKV